MRLYPRTPDDYRDEALCLRCWAHTALDAAAAGEYVEPEVIDQALRLTGDLTHYTVMEDDT